MIGYLTQDYPLIHAFQPRPARATRQATLSRTRIFKMAPKLSDYFSDGEIVALDETGRPSFNALQNYGAGAALIIYYVFDVMILAGRDVTGEPLATGEISCGGACLRNSVSPSANHPN